MSTEAPARERTLPHNPEAERTVLGAILVDNQAFNSAAEILNREDFYREAHRRIFEAMGALSERSQPIDLVTLKDELVRLSALEAVGGASYLAGLVDGVPRITSVEHWSRIIKEKAVLRNLIHAGNRIVQTCYEGEDEAAALLDRAEKSIFDIAERRIRAGFVSMREIVKESFRTIDQLSQSKDVVTGLATGFVDIDEMTSGLQKGDLVIVAARPAMGKTSFCLNVGRRSSSRSACCAPTPASTPTACARASSTRRTGRGSPRRTPTSRSRASSSTTPPPSRPSRCARSAAGSRPSTASA